MSERIYTITEFLLGGCLLYGSYYCYDILTIDKKHIYQGKVFDINHGLPKIKDSNSVVYHIDNQYKLSCINNGDYVTVIGEITKINSNNLLIPGHPRSGIYTSCHPISLIKRYLG
jgi:hypothetical protein